MVWQVKMKDEGRGKKVFQEGDFEAEVIGVNFINEKEAKSGNPYFLWKLRMEQGDIETVTTLLKGKRWLLKQILSACGIKANENDPDEKYVFSPEGVLYKKILIRIKNKNESFIGKDGKLVEFSKSEVKAVMPMPIEGKKEPAIVESIPGFPAGKGQADEKIRF